MDEKEIKKVVREGYAKIAKEESGPKNPLKKCCCGVSQAEDISRQIGYSEEELRSVPEGANLGLGCGNPVALASLKEGEVVLDLGSGPGFDCFLAAQRVGEKGKVIGVDMTSEMLEKARENATKGGYKNVEFRLGEIENLPAADNSVDIVISNCVINLSSDKGRVFKEALRVLKPGGRIMISDLVLLKELPQVILDSVEAYIGCLSGAMMKDDYLKAVSDAGFQDTKVLEETHFPIDSMANDPTAQSVMKNMNISSEDLEDIAKTVVSVKVYAVKPN